MLDNGIVRFLPRRFGLFGPAVAAAAMVLSLGGGPYAPVFGSEGTDVAYRPSNRPTIEASFARESYRPGAVARLVIFSRHARGASMQIFRAGTERGGIRARDRMRGSAVTSARRLGTLTRGRSVWVSIPRATSGLYYVRLKAGNRTGYAPFVLRPRRLGEHRVAEVLPTLTWQAYNRRDDDGDGEGDTWYVNQQTKTTARLYRPYLDRGVPPNYKYYEQPFLRWLTRTERKVDYLAQSDVAGTSGRKLAAAYDLLVFSGHHEYVTRQEYDAVEGFRNRGGNLMFLSANNFYREVVIRSGVMHRGRTWRELGRPEAALIGVQYIMNDKGEHRAAYVVRNVGAVPWLFAGTGLRNGARFGNAGIEIDKTQPSSPRGTKVVAELPNLMGRGMTGQMTYYERGGAKVFAAGAFTFAGASLWPTNRQIMENLWNRLSAR
jgi:N,N-dimethylformamidase beta subunit-like, C-terminal